MCCLLAVLKTFYNLLGYAIHANLPLLRVVLTLLLFSATAFVVIVFAFQVLDRDYKQHLPPGSKRMLTLAQVGMGVGFMLVAADSIATQLAWGGPRNWYEFLRWNVFWNLSFALFLTLAYDQVARSKFAANELHQAELADLEISRQLDAARLAVLQAQIEPHFVFNALANVRRLLRTDGLGATALLDDLLHYLKAALPALRSSKTTLAQELDLVRSFLAIHQVRMGKRLHTQVVATLLWPMLLCRPWPCSPWLKTHSSMGFRPWWRAAASPCAPSCKARACTWRLQTQAKAWAAALAAAQALPTCARACGPCTARMRAWP